MAEKPIYGLLVRPRPYKCLVDDCGHIHDVSTNHTDLCYAVCPKCNWRSGFAMNKQLYFNALQKNRPHTYVGPPITEADYNPHRPGHKGKR